MDDQLAKRFSITDGEEANVYPLIIVARHVEERCMELDQTDYIFQMWRVHTPLQENWRINIEEELATQSDDDMAFRELVYLYKYVPEVKYCILSDFV